MSLTATAPKYGWTDLAYSLVPTGTHEQEPGALPAFNGCDSAPASSTAASARSRGRRRDPEEVNRGRPLRQWEDGDPTGNEPHDLPPKIDNAITCLEGSYPPEQNPACAATSRPCCPNSCASARPTTRAPSSRRSPTTRPIGTRSSTPPASPTPLPALREPPDAEQAAQRRPRLPDPGLPRRLPALRPEQGQGVGRHLPIRQRPPSCLRGHDRLSDRQLNANSPNQVRTGVTTRLNRFIDDYARPSGNPNPPRPPFNVTATLRICPQNAGTRPADEPGPAYTAATFEQLAPNTLNLNLTGSQVTTSDVEPNPHAANWIRSRTSRPTAVGARSRRSRRALASPCTRALCSRARRR